MSTAAPTISEDCIVAPAPRQYTALEAAIAYAREGWSPIPVPHRSKNPGRAGWQNLRITETDAPHRFNGRDQNIGLLMGTPSRGLVDVDHDCAEAVLLGERMLPPTGFIFGRTSKPKSHRFYLCEPPPRRSGFWT